MYISQCCNLISHSVTSHKIQVASHNVHAACVTYFNMESFATYRILQIIQVEKFCSCRTKLHFAGKLPWLDGSLA